VVVIETVKRLAASVRTSNSNNESKPALLTKGSFTIDTNAVHISSSPTVEMLTRSRALFQFLF
jgi:hypothetical protein